MKRELQLEITGVVQGGRGLAKADGKVIFVSGALPGETVLARIEKDQERFAEAVTVRRIQSPHGEAACAHFEACGGCDWMRLDAATQLAAKNELLQHDFSRRLGAQTWLPPVASPVQSGYRSRITLKLQDGRAGYYAESSHMLIPIDDCLVAAPAIRKAIAGLARVIPAWIGQGFSEVELRAAPDDELAVGVLRGRGSLPSRPDVLRGLATFTSQSGDCDIRYEAAGASLWAGPRSFTQINLAVNSLLVGAAVGFLAQGASQDGPKQAADAFCGVGNFSIPLAKQGFQVVGFESNSPALDDAKRNANGNDVDIHWVVAQEVDMAKAWRKHGLKADARLLLDPPRAGAKKFISDLLLAKLKPQKIAYVSCEPTTLLRDLDTLQRSGYHIDHLQAFDMFPQTHHVETLACLSVAPA